LSADDRFDEIRKLLDSTLSEFESLFQSAGGFEESRVGNGWNPEKIIPDTYYLKPKTTEELVHIAEARKRTLFKHRTMPFLRPQDSEIRLLSEARLRFVPFWRIKGYHECFYFRGNSYKIDLPDDVVAVEVEGKIRDLIEHESKDSQKLSNLTRRLLGRREWPVPKSFRLGEVTELAYQYNEGSIFSNADGKEDLEAEAFFEGNVPLQKIAPDALDSRFPGAEIWPSSVAKEDLVQKLHSIIVKPPAAFSKILSNRFQITELAQLLIPTYAFNFEWHREKKELVVHGYTGSILQ
jgi:hypothetical protein